MGGNPGWALGDTEDAGAVMPQDNAVCERLTIRAGHGVANFPA